MSLFRAKLIRPLARLSELSVLLIIVSCPRRDDDYDHLLDTRLESDRYFTPIPFNRLLVDV